MPRHLLRRFEVLRQQRRRHDQCRTHIGEAFARRAIDRELAGRIERRHSGQITERVGEFVIGQPAEHDRPRIARIGQRDLIERRSHPADQLSFLFHRELLGILRRHLAQCELLLHMFPNIRLPLDLLQRSEALQVELSFLLLSRMTSHAVLAQQRPNRLVERVSSETRSHQTEHEQGRNNLESSHLSIHPVYQGLEIVYDGLPVRRHLNHFRSDGLEVRRTSRSITRPSVVRSSRRSGRVPGRPSP